MEAGSCRLVCLRHNSAVSNLRRASEVTDVRIGLEGMGIEVEGPLGRFSVRESEIFTRPARLGRRVNRNEDASYYRSGNPLSYAVTARTSYSPDRDTLALWLSGPALTGQRADAAIYSRIAVGDPAPLRCDNRYIYGWDVVLGQDE